MRFSPSSVILFSTRGRLQRKKAGGKPFFKRDLLGKELTQGIREDRGSWHCKCARLLHDIQLSEIPNQLKECITIALLPKDIRLHKKVQDVSNRQIVEVARAVWEGG